MKQTFFRACGTVILAAQACAQGTGFQVSESPEQISISGRALEAAIQKRGYVSGVKAGSLVDRKTGFHDAGFGLDIVDWLMEPGSDAGYRDRLDPELRYEYGNLVHGNIPKRSIEGPQICTKARELAPEIVRGRDFVAVRQQYRYTVAAPDRKAGSLWEQTIVFPEGRRFFLSSDRITSVNPSDSLFLRIDMPGHIRHTRGDTFSEVYLSYVGRIPAREFFEDFPPDSRFLYRRMEGKVPRRFIRAYHLRDPKTGKDGPWLAGMTLAPEAVSEAWCHQRGYVCMIEEFGGRRVRAGESFSAAFLVGYFDSIEEMERTYDRYAGATGLALDEHGWRLLTPHGPVASSLDERLEWFRDMKFGLFLHWGAYSQLGCIESWPLVWADRKWSNPGVSTRDEMTAFRKRYFDLPRTFNPVAFDPKSWAELAWQAGMRYVVFTTKHHDGFSMFDTRMTDYRVTAREVPFNRDPRADIAGGVFRAFREAGFGIGAYFSKSDWHSPYYWRPDRFAEDRNPNYDTAADPARWGRFVQFVHGQIEELMSRYGRIDVLWLDGGQVRPPKQDIRMPEVAAMARGYQPWLIMVNRTAGEYEDYRTPEQEVPPKPVLDHAWESCITMGTQWSYKPNDTYKSARDLIHLLVNVVAKGGNLLLNIGPGPDGRLPAEAMERLRAIGAWMAVNGEAIHGTRPAFPYRDGDFAFTRRGAATYAIYLGERVPAAFLVPKLPIGPIASIRLLGSNTHVEWAARDEGTQVRMPGAVAAPTGYAAVFRIDSR